MHPIDRRTLVRAAVGGVALAATGGALAGCGKRTITSTAANAAVKLPTYTPLTNGPKPDLPGTAGQTLDGYLVYPASPVTMSQGKPGDGSDVSVFVQTYSPVAPALSSNKYWQAMNQALGVNLKISVVPSTDYGDKFAALISGDLPDLLHIRTNVVDIPALLAAKCQDLSPYLSGDAVKQYPNLANIPTACWKAQCIHNGGIYGLPVPRATLGNVLFRRDDILAARGLNGDPASFAELSKLSTDLTDTKNNKWAWSNADGLFFFILQMMGVPKIDPGSSTGWAMQNGKLVNINELDQVKQALSDTATLYKAGTVHPDSFGSATQDLTTNYKQWFNAGTAALHADGYRAWWQFYVQNIAGPAFKVGGVIPAAYDGSSKPVTWQGNPGFSYTAFKKASEARIRQLLKMCDWLAAPFGSAEYLLTNYGAEGVDWARDKNGDAALNTTGKGEVPGLSVPYIVSAPAVLYYAGQPDATKDMYAFQQKYIPMSVQDPTLGLDSKTWNRVAGSLTAKLVDARHAIMRGQQPVSTWDDVMKDWRSQGGDQARGEFQDALQKNG